MLMNKTAFKQELVAIFHILSVSHHFPNLFMYEWAAHYADVLQHLNLTAELSQPLKVTIKSTATQGLSLLSKDNLNKKSPAKKSHHEMKF